MTRKSRQFVKGDTWTFKHGYHAERYGPTAVVTAVSVSVDRPHPGFIHHTWVDFVTANGTRIQWSPSTVRHDLR